MLRYKVAIGEERCKTEGSGDEDIIAGAGGALAATTRRRRKIGAGEATNRPLQTTRPARPSLKRDMDSGPRLEGAGGRKTRGGFLK